MPFDRTQYASQGPYAAFRATTLKTLTPIIVLLFVCATGATKADTSTQYDPGKNAVDLFVDLVIVHPVALSIPTWGIYRKANR